MKADFSDVTKEFDMDKYMKENYFDREGKPFKNTKEWRKRVADRDYKRVAADEVGNYWVSTVWLGMDHGYGEGPPLIFETMVFSKDKSKSDLYCDRYSTEEQAKKGHEEVVAGIKNGTLELEEGY